MGTHYDYRMRDSGRLITDKNTGDVVTDDVFPQRTWSFTDQKTEPTPRQYHFLDIPEIGYNMVQTKLLMPKEYTRRVWFNRAPLGVATYSGVNHVERLSGNPFPGTMELQYLDGNLSGDYQENPFPYHLQNKAETGALLKLKEQRSTADLGLMALEARKTSEMFISTGTVLATSYRLLKRGRVADAMNHLRTRGETVRSSMRWQPKVKVVTIGGRNYTAKQYVKLSKKQVANMWLEMQLGWGPVIADLADVVHDFANVPPELTYVRVARRESEANSRTFDVDLYETRVLCVQDTTHRCQVILRYLPTNEFLSTLTGFGLTNPAGQLWEAIPWSFVTDYLIGIGDWLNTLDATLGYRFLDGSVSLTFNETRSYLPIPGGDSPYRKLVEFQGMGGYGRYYYFQRTPYVSTPVPIPQLKSPFTPVKVLNVLALLSSAFGLKFLR